LEQDLLGGIIAKWSKHTEATMSQETNVTIQIPKRLADAARATPDELKEQPRIIR
jgi:hypothetical protein